MMFTFLLLTLLAFAAIREGVQGLSQSTLMNMQEIVKNVCKGETGVGEELLAKAKAGELSEDENFKCYLKCCLEMAQMIKDGKIDAESAIKQAEEFLPEAMKEAAIKQINACKDSVGSNPCDLAYQFTVCAYKYDKDNFLIPV